MLLTRVVQNVFQKIDTNSNLLEWLLTTVVKEDCLRMFLTENVEIVVSNGSLEDWFRQFLEMLLTRVIQNSLQKIDINSNLLEWLLITVVSEDCLRMFLTVILSEISEKIDWKELLMITLRDVADTVVQNQSLKINDNSSFWECSDKHHL